MAIKEEVQQILNVRRQKADALRQKKESLKIIKTQLQECAKLSGQANKISDPVLREQYGPEFQKVSNNLTLQREVDRIIRRLDEGIRRFEKDYISIATVGKARQGKSQFLQSVGNLENEIIPAYAASDCTGATSVIYNTPDMAPGTVSVTITFRRQEELLEIVAAYIREISPRYLAEHPLIFEEISYIDLEELRSQIPAGDQKKATALGHLEKITEHFDEICDLFGSSSITLSDPELIKTYVAQNNGKKATDPEVEYYYKYLAVARADVRCRFYEDCGKIVLVDTVGLGDTQYGIEKAMLDTVDTQCDAAIVVTKPISGAHTDDGKLYDLLREHFGNRDISKWLFYAANLHKGVNDNAVDEFAKDIRMKNYAVCDCRIVDCSDKEAVRDGFLMPLLRKLVLNMEAIDTAYLGELNVQGNAVIQKIEQYLQNAPVMDNFNPQKQGEIEAFQKGQDAYEKLTADLRRQVYYWQDEKDRPNSILWNRVQKILNELEDIVPSAEMLTKVMNENGSLLPDDLWKVALNYTRNEITDRFNAIDDLMEKETRKFKNSLVSNLYYALNGILGDGTEREGGEPEDIDMSEWLKTIMEQVIRDKPEYSQIYKAFQFLYQFHFNMREHINQAIRRQLYIISPLSREYAKPERNFNGSNIGEEVNFYLVSRLSVIEENLRYSLVNMYRTPNQTFYAAAEEFYDRLTFASDLKDGQFVDMKRVWGQFFTEYSNKLWQDNSKRYDEVGRLIKIYNGARMAMKQHVNEIRF